MTLLNVILHTLVYLALMQIYGCGSVGWLPTLSIAVAGIDRTQHQPDQTEKKKFILKAEGRLKWKLEPGVNRSVSQPIDDSAAAIYDEIYQTDQTDALYEWEYRERNRVVDEADREWRL